MTTTALTLGEARIGAVAGVDRRINRMRLGVPDRFDDGRGIWHRDIHAALAEMAVAKATGLFWTGCDPAPDHDTGDVGRRIQVRTTNAKEHLIIRERDKDEDVFVLALGGPLDWRIAGWIIGADARRREWHHAGNPPYWVVPLPELAGMRALNLEALR